MALSCIDESPFQLDLNDNTMDRCNNTLNESRTNLNQTEKAHFHNNINMSVTFDTEIKPTYTINNRTSHIKSMNVDNKIFTTSNLIEDHFQDFSELSYHDTSEFRTENDNEISKTIIHTDNINTARNNIIRSTIEDSEGLDIEKCTPTLKENNGELIDKTDVNENICMSSDLLHIKSDEIIKKDENYPIITEDSKHDTNDNNSKSICETVEMDNENNLNDNECVKTIAIGKFIDHESSKDIFPNSDKILEETSVTNDAKTDPDSPLINTNGYISFNLESPKQEHLPKSNSHVDLSQPNASQNVFKTSKHCSNKNRSVNDQRFLKTSKSMETMRTSYLQDSGIHKAQKLFSPQESCRSKEFTNEHGRHNKFLNTLRQMNEQKRQRTQEASLQEFLNRGKSKRDVYRRPRHTVTFSDESPLHTINYTAEKFDDAYLSGTRDSVNTYFDRNRMSPGCSTGSQYGGHRSSSRRIAKMKDGKENNLSEYLFHLFFLSISKQWYFT